MSFHHVALPRQIYRVSYGNDPLAYPPLAILRARGPGRWDDLKYRFRTGYFGDSLFTCFIETLANLRPDPSVVEKLRKMGVPPPDMDLAVAQALSNKYASVVIVPNHDPIVDIIHPHSRAEFEMRTKRRKKLKAGDFLARNLSVPRRAAGIVYDAGEAGISAPSAEALCVDSKSDATTFNIFETTIDSNCARVDLVTHTTIPATEERIALAAARDFLGI